MAIQEKYLKPDSKGRITLGVIAKNIVQYKMIEEQDGKIILLPEVAVPLNEAWLYQNKEALEAVKRGLEQSSKTETVSRGSFSQYADD